ncbi:hypothetical protein HGRIS_004903 [Hohenbuehelia grisea]|uniref:Carbohydrate-binding module family 19 domain-containing protein n=1 Tax=Hohenbuehelia grisea TaxID=104357 RepID=A0ABR3JF03_9AGAR
MVSYATVFVALAASVNGLPLWKRIAQTIPESTAKWEKACLAAGGGLKCNPVSVTAFTTLLAAAGPCEQQDAADAMIDLAKTLNNDASMISLAQIFAQQPRNTPTSLSVPYCQKAPKNSELNGLFQCQFAGANPKTFVGGVAVGGQGTIPFGQNAPVNPPGSCPANPNGAVADGKQLADIAQNPGSGKAPAAASPAVAASDAAMPTAVSPGGAPASGSVATGAAMPTGAGAGAGASSGNGAPGFLIQNGKDAQALNAKFASLSAESSCQADENACIKGAFAKCNFGKFVIMPCGETLTCMALPLVNKAGTSITCTTTADAEARIAATGVAGGVTSNGVSSIAYSNDSVAPKPQAPAPAPAAAAAPASSAKATSGDAASGDFKVQNGKDAQTLNAKFAGLSESASCTDGENACVSGKFAQCVAGKFVLTPCGQGLTCMALPLVNKPGTSITCTTTAGAQARIAASGGVAGA